MVKLLYLLVRSVERSVEKKLLWYQVFRIFRIIALLTGLFLFFQTLFYHTAIIGLNSPQEYREDTLVIFTQRILDHQPIFTISTMPAYANGYGMIYSYLVAGIVKITGNIYVVHRITTAVLLFLCYIFLYKVARKLRADPLAFFLGILISYYFAATSPPETLTRADSLGMFFFFLTVFVPWLGNFSHSSLLISIVASILAFYTKPYFVLGIVHVGVYMVLNRHFKKVFLYAVEWLTIFGLVAFWVHTTYDFYFFNTVTLFNKVLNYLWWYFKLQTKDYIMNNLALFVLSIVAIISLCKELIWQLIFRKSSTKKQLEHYSYLYLVVALLVSWMLVAGRLGGNAGSYLTYYNQIITPFMLLVVVGYWKHSKSIIPVIVLFISICTILVKANFSVNVQAVNRNRAEWEEYLNKRTAIFTGPAFAYYAYMRHMPVYDAGQAEYFHQGTPTNNSKEATIANERYAQSIKDLEKKIMNKELDTLIYLVPYTNGVDNLMYSGYLRDYVKAHYRYVGTRKWISAYSMSDMEIWER